VIAKLREIYSLLSRAEKRRLWLLLCLMLLATLIEVVGVGSVFPLLQLLSAPERFAQGPVAVRLQALGLTSVREITLLLIGVFAGFLVLSNLLSVLVLSESSRFAWNNWRNVAIRAFRHYLQRPYGFFLGRNSADLTKVVIQDSEFLGYGVLLPLLQIAAKLLVIAALGVTLLAIEPVATLLLLVLFSAAYGAFSLYSHHKVRAVAAASQSGRTRATRVAAEAFRGIKDLKIFDRSDFFVRQFARETAPVPNAERSMFLLGSAPRYYLEAVTIALVLGGLATAVLLQLDLAAWLPSVGLFVVAGYRMLPLFSQGYLNLNTLLARLVMADTMLADLRALGESAAAPERPAGAAGPVRIALEDVSFTYAGTAAPALRKVSLVLEPGQKIGLLGRSGGGKSTLIDVLLTLLEPQSGGIRMGAAPIDRSNAHRLRSRIGYVPQSIFLLDRSILANIAFGVDEEDADLPAVVKAAAQADIHAFIASLELGYRTLIGEQGVRLSGGQRQRLGIARALYGDPPVIVFDEATSALDAETEAAVMAAIDRLEGKTVVIAAHRLSALRRCDAVYEVRDGRLIHLGRGDALDRGAA